jgi:hypothetical protein
MPLPGARVPGPPGTKVQTTRLRSVPTSERDQCDPAGGRDEGRRTAARSAGEELRWAEVLEIVDVSTPVPGQREILVRVAGASVNFADVLVRTGLNVRHGVGSA